jgi:hypothetical protein
VIAIGTPVPLLFPIDQSPFSDQAKIIHIDLEAGDREELAG